MTHPDIAAQLRQMFQTGDRRLLWSWLLVTGLLFVALSLRLAGA